MTLQENTYGQIQELPVEKAPETVVSLVPSVTESMFELNLGSKLIARTDYCIFPVDKVEALPSVGGTKKPGRAKK